MRPVTLVGYEEGPHPLMSGKAVENQLAIFTPVTRSPLSQSYIVMIHCGQLPVTSVKKIILGKNELRPATHSTLCCLIMNV